MNLEKLESLEQEYGIDTREMGKLLIVASIVTFLLAVNLIYGLQGLQNSVSDANRNLTEARGIIQTDTFQSSLESLRNVQGTGISRDAALVAESFEEAQGSLRELEEAEEDLESQIQTYRYVVLISITGTVAGMVLMVI